MAQKIASLVAGTDTATLNRFIQKKLANLPKAGDRLPLKGINLDLTLQAMQLQQLAKISLANEEVMRALDFLDGLKRKALPFVKGLQGLRLEDGLAKLEEMESIVSVLCKSSIEHLQSVTKGLSNETLQENLEVYEGECAAFQNLFKALEEALRGGLNAYETALEGMQSNEGLLAKVAKCKDDPYQLLSIFTNRILSNGAGVEHRKLEGATFRYVQYAFQKVTFVKVAIAIKHNFTVEPIPVLDAQIQMMQVCPVSMESYALQMGAVFQMLSDEAIDQILEVVKRYDSDRFGSGQGIYKVESDL